MKMSSVGGALGGINMRAQCWSGDEGGPLVALARAVRAFYPTAAVDDMHSCRTRRSP